MNSYSLAHLSDGTLLRSLSTLIARDRSITAALLAHIAEVDARKLYLPAGYASMFAYCVGELRLSEEAAFKRIHAARAARRFPAIFAAIEDGRLHLSAAVMLAPHLEPESAEGLIEAAAGKTKSELECLLATRFPRPDLPACIRTVSPTPPGALETQHAPGRVEGKSSEPIRHSIEPPASFHPPRPKVAPLAPERFALQLTMTQNTHDKLRRAQELLSHQIPGGDLGQLLDRALDALIHQLEKRKLAATSQPRKPPGASNRRTIPAHVRRAVWRSDQGQCTFVSAKGHRCESRRFLEFDHVDPVARGGQATVLGVRLRCRAHNQYGAECAFGTEFMRRKREVRAAVLSASASRVPASSRSPSPASSR